MIEELRQKLKDALQRAADAKAEAQILGKQIEEWEVANRPPPPAKRIGNYAVATAKWITAGRPVRSDDEVAELRQICAECERFNGHVCTHPKCGCPVVRPSVFGDKLKWATEHCPLEKW